MLISTPIYFINKRLLINRRIYYTFIEYMFVWIKLTQIIFNGGCKMIILGIDPGIAILGYGIVEYNGNTFKTLDYGAVLTDSKETTPNRLNKIYEELGKLLDIYKPDAVAIEELFFNKNAKTAIVVGQARGVAILAAAQRNLEIFEYTPLQVKQGVVGYGRADKKQVQVMVKTFLNLKTVPKPDDVADALAVAICHAHTGRMSNMFKL